MSELIKRRERLIRQYAEEARRLKLKSLPESQFQIVNLDNALIVDEKAKTITVYVHHRELWREKLRSTIPGSSELENVEIDNGLIRFSYEHENGLRHEESIRTDLDENENERYFIREITIKNARTNAAFADFQLETSYYPEGALSDFTYVSFKWMGRKENLGAYPYPSENNEYLSTPANNQLFYNVSGGIYCGVAYLDVTRAWHSNLIRDDARLWHVFRLEEQVKLAPGESVTFEFPVFAGTGNENHIGHLSNTLWRLNSRRDDAIHAPQTDMTDFIDKIASTWERSVLNGNVERDHYAAHFFSDFFGQYPEGHRPEDQFGCSWLAYDLLKARYYLRKHQATREPKYRQYAENLIKFYLYDHFVGESALTYPFHTGEFMKNVLPFCEKAGWGAPLDPERVDSLGLPEMIYDGLVLFEMDPTLFPNDYPRVILDDVLSLRQSDGHFRRLYDSRLRPVEKVGWVNQYSETQTWIPILLKLFNLTGDERAHEAALSTGERVWLDMRELGLFAMGGCETDYPDYWDVDGYRTMLWAFLDLHDATGDAKWADRAEEAQLFNNAMMLGYNVPPPKNTFYERINWKPRGMVATSFYPHPDYTRLECTATGNQTVCWVGLLLLRLYMATSKEIYAQRGIAAFRQTMVLRDEESLTGNKHRRNILHTIMENNPQIDDEAGLYENGVAQNSYSSLTDIYVHLEEILAMFGGVSVHMDPEKRHAFGVDCVDVLSYSFAEQEVNLVVQNTLPRPHKTTMKLFGSKTPLQIRSGNKSIATWRPQDEHVPIEFKANERKRITVVKSV